MKQIITSILVAIAIGFTCNAKNDIDPGKEKETEVIFEWWGEYSSPFRSASFVPIQGYYVHSTRHVCFIFQYYMGDLTYKIESIDTNTYLSGVISSSYGIATISIATLVGTNYSIIFETEDGQVIVGKFSIK